MWGGGTILGRASSIGPTIFSANFIYSIPVLRNSSSAVAKSALGGWQISGIVTVESGLPINVTGGSNNIGGTNSPGNRPDLNGKITYMHKGVGADPAHSIQYFDTSVFSLPAPGTFGNLGHNALRG